MRDWAEKKQVMMRTQKHPSQPHGELWNKDHPMDEPRMGQKWANHVPWLCLVAVCVDPEGCNLQR